MDYPMGIKKSNNHIINYSHRGMNLEDDINQTNEYYRNKDIAYIYKKPTPIKVTKVDFRKDRTSTIKEAFYEEPSTTDYNGIYKSYYIDFEAKQTKNKTAFPLANIHKHQIVHLKNITKHGGIGFIIVRFDLLGETYLLKDDDLFSFIKNNSRKSIPVKYFKEKGHLIKEGYNPRLDYLKIIDEFLEVKNNGKN